MTTKDELADAFACVRGYLDALESHLADGQEDPAAVRATLVKLAGTVMAHGRPPVKAGNKPRGLGYDKDEAMIMAFVDDYGGSIEMAARAHWDGEDEDLVDAKIRKLYRHKKEIDELGEGVDY